VDDGAREAVQRRGASLLSSGIVEVVGHFAAGAPVRICDKSGTVVARGLVSYSSDEIQRVAGRNSRELPAILGYTYTDEIVHRNDMVVEPATVR